MSKRRRKSGRVEKGGKERGREKMGGGERDKLPVSYLPEIIKTGTFIVESVDEESGRSMMDCKPCFTPYYCVNFGREGEEKSREKQRGEEKKERSKGRGGEPQ
jgi:hypothetical protein